MTPEETQAITNAFDEKIKTAATKAEIEALKTEFIQKMNDLKTVTPEQLKEAVEDFNTKLKAQWEEVVKRVTPEAKAEHKTAIEKMKDAIIKSGAVEKFTDEDGNERYKFRKLTGSKDEILIDKAITLKAVDMNTANAVRPGGTPGIAVGFLTDYTMTPQVLPLTLDQHFIQAGFPVSNITDKYFGVVIESTESNGAAVKAETASAGDSSFLWESKEFKVLDYASKFRVHQNTLDDMSNVMQRIQTLGIDRLLSVIDVACLASAGDNLATAYGLKNAGYFTAYNTALRAGEVQGANIVNVIKNAVLQAQLANRNVNAVLLHPTDIAEIEDLKDLMNNSVNLAGIRFDATGKLAYVYGLVVIRNANVSTNTCFLVDRNESIQFGVRENAGLRIGFDKSDDFSKNIVTIQIEARLAIGLGAPGSIIYISDIAAAQTALTVV